MTILSLRGRARRAQINIGNDRQLRALNSPATLTTLTNLTLPPSAALFLCNLPIRRWLAICAFKHGPYFHFKRISQILSCPVQYRFERFPAANVGGAQDLGLHIRLDCRPS